MHFELTQNNRRGFRRHLAESNTQGCEETPLGYIRIGLYNLTWDNQQLFSDKYRTDYNQAHLQNFLLIPTMKGRQNFWKLQLLQK